VRRAALTVCSVALAAVFWAGCGGDGENDAAREWATSVCSSIGDWRADVQANIENLRQDPGAISADALREAADDSLQSTETLLDELRGLGAPETEAGERARDEVEQLLESLEQRIARVRETAEAAEAGVASVLATLASISTQVQGAADDTSETLRELEELDPGGPLAEAFRDEDACRTLRE
jgi:hypothetical protein